MKKRDENRLVFIIPSLFVLVRLFRLGRARRARSCIRTTATTAAATALTFFLLLDKVYGNADDERRYYSNNQIINPFHTYSLFRISTAAFADGDEHTCKK